MKRITGLIIAMLVVVPAQANSDTLFVARDVVNCRKAPTTKSGILCGLKRGIRVVTLDSVAGEWVKIKAGDIEGWVFGPLLDARTPNPGQPKRRAKSGVWRTVESFRVSGQLLGLQDPADVVYDVLTPEYRVADPDVVHTAEGMVVTQHYRVGSRYIDITFKRSFGEYRVTRIRIKD